MTSKRERWWIMHGSSEVVKMKKKKWKKRVMAEFVGVVRIQREEVIKSWWCGAGPDTASSPGALCRLVVVVYLVTNN